MTYATFEIIYKVGVLGPAVLSMLLACGCLLSQKRD